MSDEKMNEIIQLQILAEYYFRKGNVTAAKDLFLFLHNAEKNNYQYCYYLGKIHYRLGDIKQSLLYLEQARDINPLHRQTLLLLHHCYSRTKSYTQAFECILDLYILAKEVKDQHIFYYEKRIKATSRRIENFTPEKKAQILKSRIEAMQNFFYILEKNRQFKSVSVVDASNLPHHPTEEISPHLLEEPFEHSDEIQASSPSSMQKKASPLEDDSMEDDLEFDVYPTLQAGPTLVQTLEDEKTFVDNHGMEPKIPPTQTPMTPPLTDSSTPINHPLTPLGQALLQIPFLRDLEKTKLDKIQHFTSILEFEPGETIFAQNDPVFGFHVLMEGEITIEKGRNPLFSMSAPKIIDEDDFFRVSTRSLGAVAKQHAKVLFFNKAGYQNIYQRDLPTAISLLWHFSQSLIQKIDFVIEEILLQNPTESFVEELDQKHETSIMRKLNPQEVQVLSSLFEPISLKKNDFLFTKQENRKGFYVVLEGQIECSNPKRHPILIQRNEFFGEMVFCGPGYPHLYNASVLSDSAKVIEISLKQLSSLSQFELSEQRFLADMMVRILANKHKELVELLYQTQYIAQKG